MITGIPESVRMDILTTLKNIELELDVTIIYACESGSHAWGFPSPNSDYDVRFIYVPKPEYYLRLDPQPDTIQRNALGDLDVVGWELRKALNLLRKSNPPLLEWLNSPIVYRNSTNAAELTLMSESYYDPEKLIAAHHSIATTNEAQHLRGDQVNFKKYLYTLRSLLSIEYVRAGFGWPPVSFRGLLDVVDIPQDVRDEIDILLYLKQSTPESFNGAPSEVITRYIRELLNRPLEQIESWPKPIHQLQTFMRKTVEQYSAP